MSKIGVALSEESEWTLQSRVTVSNTVKSRNIRFAFSRVLFVSHGCSSVSREESTPLVIEVNIWSGRRRSFPLQTILLYVVMGCPAQQAYSEVGV